MIKLSLQKIQDMKIKKLGRSLIKNIHRGMREDEEDDFDQLPELQCFITSLAGCWDPRADQIMPGLFLSAVVLFHQKMNLPK